MAGTRLPSMEVLDRAPAPTFVRALGPLFEDAPGFLARLAAARPFGTWERLFGAAEGVALDAPEADQVELLDAHPRIGADPASMSALSTAEQGHHGSGGGEARTVAADLARLNAAYEARFGFRYVVFVAGRPRAAIVPLLAMAIEADPEAERRRGLRDVVAIGRARARTLGTDDEGGGA